MHRLVPLVRRASRARPLRPPRDPGEVALLFRALDTWDPDVSRVVKVLRPDLGGDAEPLLKLRREIDVRLRSAARRDRHFSDRRHGVPPV